MNCPRCGNNIRNGGRFCGRCGCQINGPQSYYDRNNMPKKHAGHAALIIGVITAGLSLTAVMALIVIVSSSAPDNIGLVTGESTTAVSAEIGSGGGTFSIGEGELAGFSIGLIEDTFDQSVKFSVSTAPIESHGFGGSFSAASPLITIDNDGIFSDIPMTVTIPIQKEDDEFAMAFYYDGQTRSLQGLPLLSLTNSELVTMTQHFSDIVVSKIKKDKIETVYDTGFRPKTDDFQIPNPGSYIAPGGHCVGQCVAMAYYYLRKDLSQGNALYGRFDNDGRNKTPDIWYDDADAVRLCSSIQSISKDMWDKPTKAFSDFIKIFNADDTQTYYAMLYAMMFSEQPQMISCRAGNSGHAVLAFKVTTDAIYIADPNYPGDSSKRIPITQDGSGKIQFGEYEKYNKIGFYGLYAMLNEEKTYGLWREVIDGSPTLGISAADYFPDDVMIEVAVGEDKDGRIITKTLTDGFILTEENIKKLGIDDANLMCRVVNAEIEDDIVMITDTGNLDMGVESFYHFKIKQGMNHIRILFAKDKKYVNFYRYDLIYKNVEVKLTADPMEAGTGETVFFTADMEEGPYTFKWNFGNGQTDTGSMATNTYIYTNAGTYAVSAVIYNKSGEYLGKAETTVTVTETETAAAPESAEESAPEPETEDPRGLYGKWLVVFDNMGFDDGYYAAYVVQVNDDGTWSGTPLLYTLDGKQSRPMPEFAAEPASYLTGTFTYDENTGKGTMYNNAGGWEFRYEYGQFALNGMRYKKIE